MLQKLNVADDLSYNNGETFGVMSSGKKRILCVDDDEEVLNITRTVLEYLGYDVVVSISAIEAINIFQSQEKEFDLVITDLKMPVINGMQLSQRLLNKNPHIPIIICTGSCELIIEEEAQRIGIKEIISKPFSIEKAAQVIDKVIGENSGKRGRPGINK
jgi:CheY-like chemotaxis protein